MAGVMKVLLDTSVLVAAMVEAHPMHREALPWLQRVKAGVNAGVVTAHVLAELYAVLTTLPVQPPISSIVAYYLISHNIVDSCEVVSLTAQDYMDILSHLSKRGIVGGATYDALIMHAALKTNVDHIVTFNERDFRRIYPELADKVISPSSE